MRLTFDPVKRERTSQDRGLDFLDAAIVFDATTVEIDTHAGITVSDGSFATACFPTAWS